MEVRFDRGIHLPEAELWLDPHVAQPVAFVSHAHADHVAAHAHVLATAATAAMMRLRARRGTTARFRPLAYREPYSLGSCSLTLYPAGHVLGSAQALVEREGRRLLYSGDFKLRPGRSAEPAEVPRADVAIMETTFGRPRYRFPPAEEVAAAIRDFCTAALAADEVAVLFCYTLGKGQEVLAWLDGLVESVWLHPAHAEMAALYRSLGVALPAARSYTPGAPLSRAILLCPPGARRADWLRAVRRPRTAYLSGWALDRAAPGRFGVERCFALSDHADYDDLLEYARRCGARQIYTVHGFAAEFARDLRARGYQAQSLSEPETGGEPSAQLVLPM
jgi:Cft2 family RNA processing exonuclease